MFVNAQRISTFCGDQETRPDRVVPVTMSKSPQIDKVQPCLLDRLVDERPEVRTETTGRGISLSRYRQGVLRDIEWLLNAKRRLAHEGSGVFPETEHFGVDFRVPRSA